MRGRAVFCLFAVLEAGMVEAQERSAPAGAITVRPVQVREVRVNPPPAPPRQERASFGVERPVDHNVISRADHRPQTNATAALPSKRYGRSHAPATSRHRGPVVGYPVLYPYAYPFDPFSPTSTMVYSAPPARNTYSSVDSSAGGASMTAAPPLPAAVACEGAAPCGGITFDVGPVGAQVSVDGVFVGSVNQFAEVASPLLLAPGDHFIEVRLPGYRTVSFDVAIVPGEVTPYQGMLERLRQRRP